MASAVPGTRTRSENHRRNHRGKGKDTPGGRLGAPRRDEEKRLRARDGTVLLRAPRRQHRRRNGRPQNVRSSSRDPCGNDRRLHDSRLGAHPLRHPRDSLEQDNERGQAHQPRSL